MNNHIKAEANSKFHVFLNLIGLEHFKFSIIEICSPDIAEQGKRENYYLQKFLPILKNPYLITENNKNIIIQFFMNK